MAYRIEVTPSARSELASLGRQVQRQVAARIDSLAENPRPRGAQKLADGCYRIRSGSYRILYDVADDVLIVLVVRIRHRKEVYRGDPIKQIRRALDELRRSRKRRDGT